ncbi:MAG: hypothetical protein AB8B56_08840 [Crocinitomicaceae bacterium]
MWANKSILWSFPIIAGIALGVLGYSFQVWTTNIPEIFIEYWFGPENLTLVFTITALIFLVYVTFLIIWLGNKNISRLLKIWMLLGMFVIAVISTLTLSYTQRFRSKNLELEFEKEKTNQQNINNWDL